MSKQAEKPLCRYHVQGCCRLGSQCTFTHALPAKGQDTVCQFYLAGSCAYGAKCRYDHVRPNAAKQQQQQRAAPPVVLRRPLDAARPAPAAAGAPSPRADVATDAAAPAPVAAAVVGSRPWAAVVGPAATDTPDLARLRLEEEATDGEEAFEPEHRPDGHKGAAAAAFDPWAVLTAPAKDAGPVSDAAQAAAASRAEREAALARSSEVECCVCLEVVLQKPQAAQRRFGLLSGCNHAFCVACIRDWRAGGVADVASAKALDHARTCPVCRSPSHYVIPSSTWPADEAQKAAVMDAYKARLAAIPCRHFDDGRGSCPFGSSCWYAHRVQGVDVTALPLRKAGTADGDVRVVEPVRLAAFLER